MENNDLMDMKFVEGSNYVVGFELDVKGQDGITDDEVDGAIWYLEDYLEAAYQEWLKKEGSIVNVLKKVQIGVGE